MSVASHAQALWQTLPPAAENKALTSSFVAQIELLNEQVRDAFLHMLNARKNESRECITASHKHRVIRWLIKAFSERLDSKADKKRSWIKSDFVYDQGKLWRLSEKIRTERREIISEDRIFETIARVHISLGHIEQNVTAIHISKEYYRIAHEEVNFLVKLCEICHMENLFSKFHMLFPIINKEAPTVARKIHHWIAVLAVFEIL